MRLLLRVLKSAARTLLTCFLSASKRPRKTVKMTKTKKVQFAKFGDDLEVLSAATTGGFSNLFRFIFIWPNSVYKIICVEMIIFLLAFYALHFAYRFGFDDSQKYRFENAVLAVNVWVEKLPVIFLLGFYVRTVVSRWLSTYDSIPRLGGFAVTLQKYVYDPKRRTASIHFRRLIVRYVNLAWLMGMRPQSQILQNRLKVAKSKLPNDTSQKEFLRLHLKSPNEDPVVQKYLRQIITDEEVEVLMTVARERFEDMRPDEVAEAGGLATPDWWIPLQWAGSVLDCAVEQGFIANVDANLALNACINGVGRKIAHLIATSQRPLPLVYHQVVIIATYVYFVSGILAYQFLDADRLRYNHTNLGLTSSDIKTYAVPYYFPLFVFLKMLFILGWFKVAFVMLNPFGTDEEDFDFSKMFNSNLRSTSLCAESLPSSFPDELHGVLSHPTEFDPGLSVLRNDQCGQHHQRQRVSEIAEDMMGKSVYRYVDIDELDTPL